MKKAFTLSELLVTLAVIGVVATISISAMSQLNVNKEALQFRKAYKTTTNIIYEMMQSTGYYSTASFTDTSATSIAIDGTYPSGNTKFCKIFASFLNTQGSVSCGSSPAFTTVDGMQWYIPNWTSSIEGMEIGIDVNGSKKPNCVYSASSCPNPDQFKITINKTGKISLTGKELEYLQDDSKMYKKNKATSTRARVAQSALSSLPGALTNQETTQATTQATKNPGLVEANLENDGVRPSEFDW